MQYDIAILGGGPAGYTAAGKALREGLSVVLFEKKAIGGVCLNEGCIPTKTLLYSAKQYYNTLNADKYGVTVSGTEYDWNRIQQRKNKVIRKLQAGIRAKINNPKCLFVPAEAIVKSRDESTIVVEAGNELYEASNLLICTGSVNAVPPIKGIDSDAVLDSTKALNMTELPKSIIIVGGGVIGMEFATLYRELGIEVAVVEALPHILNNIDTDITDYLMTKYQKNGIRFYIGTKVESIEGNKVVCRQGDDETELEADRILVCVGRRIINEAFDVLNLEREGRAIRIDECCRTSLPNVYAAGDVTGKLMLAHVASRQAEIAIDTIIGKQTEPLIYNNVPSVVYTNPEIATIGCTAADSPDIQVKSVPMTYSGRFVAENEAENGLCKVYYHSDGLIAGAVMIGNNSSEIIALMSMAINRGLNICDLEQIVFPHPTVSEIFKEALV